MAPAKRRRRMNARERRGLRQALAFDHRSGVIEPAVLLAQMRHWGLGQRVERAPQLLQRNRKVRASGPSRRSRGPRNADSPGPRRAHDWSFQARPRAGRAGRLSSSDPAPNPLSRGHSLPCSPPPAPAPLPAAALRLIRNPRKPRRKVLSLHRINLRNPAQSDPNQHLTL